MEEIVPPSPNRSPMADGDSERRAGPYTPVERRSKLVLTFLGCQVVAAAIAAASGAVAAAQLYRVDPRGSEAAAIVERLMAASVMWLATVLVSLPAFLAWFRRAYNNLPALGAGHLHEPVDALWRSFMEPKDVREPRRLMVALWDGSDPDQPPGEPRPWDPDTPRLITTWWALWLVSPFAAASPFVLNLVRAFDGPALRSWLVAGAGVGAALWCAAVGAAVSLALLVRRIAARQTERARRLAVTEATTATPSSAP